ncbi:MAG: hypothetical protein IPJ61_13100 [Tessaracoccus sp.]|uniref:FitA-like ribbon-helix-helix domain-containing protein n=1 Tax=Tessaracoccus sp. TaxID=1971211 RepID=UPI001ECB5BBB|nr:hypothetical protein [Tessaracoccus sp.]MBK7821972.1 hypothetical protein [Tessaracoccus sp.]
MTISITVRNVPNETRDALAERAARTGRSLQEYLAGELNRLASEPSVDEWLSESRRLAATIAPEVAENILEAREADRR